MANESARLGLGARFFGVVFSPQATFERVAADPRWLGMLALTVGLFAAMVATLMSTDVMQRAILDQQNEAIASFGVEMTDEMYTQMEEQMGMTPIYTAVSTLVFVPIGCLILAGVLYAAGYGLFGPRATFEQMFAVVAHAGVIFVVTQLFVAPLNYFREAADSPTTLAAFAPMLETGTFAVNLLSAIDLIHVWWLMVLAIGLGVVWQRQVAGIVTTLYALQVTVALVVAIVRTTIGF